jgi:hypothetical protein
MGGTHAQAPILGGSTTKDGDDGRAFINMQRQVVSGAVPKGALAGDVKHWQWTRYQREMRGDIYSELTKLPLRFQLHPFDALERAAQQSAVGYTTPLGAADADDTIPFFVHRTSDGQFPDRLHSLNPKLLMPSFYLVIEGIEGDVFRFEEELIKIFPTKKTFVRSHKVFLYNAGEDAREILHHWLLGLGF